MSAHDDARRVIETFHAFSHLVMEQIAPYIWGQPASIGRLSLISAAATFELLAKELRAAGERDLSIPSDVFERALQACADHRLEFNLRVKPPEELLQERKDQLH